MIKVDNITFTYPDGTTALRDVSLTVKSGHISAILGESGSGKTTLLRCIGRFIKPGRGVISLDGQDIWDYPEIEFRTRLGLVFQHLHLFPHLTVLQNMVLAPEKVLGKDRVVADQQAREMLDQLRIGDLADRYPNQISGGQAQRVAIARALMLKPEYLLLDEPTSALDINTTEEFADWLLDLQSYTAFIIVTHDMPFAAKVAAEGVLMADGVVRYQGDMGKAADVFQNN